MSEEEINQAIAEAMEEIMFHVLHHTVFGEFLKNGEG